MVKYGKHVISEPLHQIQQIAEVMDITINGEEIIQDILCQQNDSHDMIGKIIMTMLGEIRPILN